MIQASVTSATTGTYRIAVVEVPTEARIKRLKWISSESRPKDADLEKALIRIRLRQAEEQTRASLIRRLKERSNLIVLNDPTIQELSQTLDLAHGDQDIPSDSLHRFRDHTQADGILRFRITDYGQTPRKVMKWVYIGTGAWVAGVVTLAAVRSETRPYIGAYIGSEVLQEGAELYLGTSLFGYEYKPVRIEAELIEAMNGKTLWEDAKTKTASGRLMKAYPKNDRKRKEIQLAVSTENALGALVASLVRSTEIRSVR